MEVIIEDHYTIELVKYEQEGSNIVLHISYSCKKWPDFKDFLTSSIFEQTPILYQDGIKNYKLLLNGYSFSLANTPRITLENEDIVLRKETYGEIINQITKENRRSFILTQAYGVIRAQIL